jgi:hypothetical protein
VENDGITKEYSTSLRERIARENGEKARAMRSNGKDRDDHRRTINQKVSIKGSEKHDDQYWRHRFDGIVGRCSELRHRSSGEKLVSDYILDTVIREAMDSMWTYRDATLAVQNALDELQAGVSDLRKAQKGEVRR